MIDVDARKYITRWSATRSISDPNNAREQIVPPGDPVIPEMDLDEEDDQRDGDDDDDAAATERRRRYGWIPGP